MPESPDVRRALDHLPPTPLPEAEVTWSRIRAALDEPGRSVRRPGVRAWVAAVGVAAALLVGAAAGLWWQYRAPAAWPVVRLAGSPSVAGDALVGEQALRAGDWLVTDGTSRAHLAVGRIGSAEIGPDSRVRIDRDGLTGHRLTLERGSIEAVITAPPRLFFVRTPAVLATDLGCAYTLAVDSAGTSRLHVTAGWVELAEAGGRALVPAGLVAVVEPGERPGTPYPADLADAPREALARLDAGTGTDADLALVLASVGSRADYVTRRKQAGITLWHLLQRVPADRRGAVAERLETLAPPPAGVTMEGILALNRPMLERWRRDLHPMWSEEALPWYGRMGRRLWTWLMR